MKESGLVINGCENIKCSISTNFMDISKIVLFERDLGERGSIRTINLSERFVESARRSLI